MLTRLVDVWRRGRGRAVSGQDARCTACPLDVCRRGSMAAVLRMECATEEACRLRNMGLHEGACVRVLDSQEGLLLEVRGAKVALGAALAASIVVLPLGS